MTADLNAIVPRKPPTKRELYMRRRTLEKENKVIAAARAILRSRIRQGSQLDCPNAVRDYLRASLGALEAMRFDLLILDGRNRMVGHLELFNGTINHVSIYRREVVKLAMIHGAQGVICALNRIDAPAEPTADILSELAATKEALALVGIMLTDVFIVARDAVYSCRENGHI